MLTFRACYPEHVRLLQVQPEQRGDFAYMLGTGGEENVLNGMSFSAWQGTRCVAAGGVFAQWAAHGIAWMFADPAAGADMVQLTRFARGLIRVSPYRRVSITVDCDFLAGHRWAKCLGFVLECPRMQAYGQTGRDHALYKWIRKA